MDFPDPVSDGGHDRILCLFLPVAQAEVNGLGLYGMRTEIFCEIRVPDGGRCCGHAGERACLTGSPKGEKPDKGVSADHILFSWLSSQFQDLVQRFLCTGTEFQVPVYCRSAPGGQVVEPVIRLDCQQMEIISDKPFDPAYFGYPSRKDRDRPRTGSGRWKHPASRIHESTSFILIFSVRSPRDLSYWACEMAPCSRKVSRSCFCRR